MKNWTIRRRISFWVHVAFVGIPFGISTVSAFLLWKSLFNDPWLALALVGVVEVLSLTGLVLYIARIPSPFHFLRHALPFISVVPLCWELYRLLQHNSGWTPIVATGIVAAILVAVAYQCFKTIENLFIDQVAAAHERAAERVAHMEYELAELQKRQQIVAGFFETYTTPHYQLVAPAKDNYLDTLLALQETPGDTEAPQVVSQDTHNDTSPHSAPSSIAKMVKAYKDQGLTVAEILERHPEWRRNTVAPAYSRA